MSVFSFSSLKSFFRESTMQNMVKQAGWLWAGRLTTAVLGLLALSLTAHGLTKESFGTLVLIQAYVTILEQLITFASWKALIKYGMEALEAKNTQRFRGLVKFCTLLDIGAAVLAAGLGIAGIWIFATLKDWEASTRSLAVLYCVVLTFKLSGCPTAVLRIFQKFHVIAIQECLGSFVRVIVVFLAWWVGSDLWGFILAWVVSDIFTSLLLLLLGWRELTRREHHRVWGESIRDTLQQHPSLWNFVWISNLNTTSAQVLMQMDVFIINAILGTAATATYKIMKSFGTILHRLSAPLRQVLYPQITALHARHDHVTLQHLLKRMFTLLGSAGAVLWLGFLLLGYPAIMICFGQQYTSTFVPACIYFLGEAIRLLARPFNPLLLVKERHFAIFVINTTSMIAFLLTLIVAVWFWGIVGSALAYVFSSLVLLGLSAQYTYTHREALFPPHPGDRMSDNERLQR